MYMLPNIMHATSEVTCMRARKVCMQNPQPSNHILLHVSLQSIPLLTCPTCKGLIQAPSILPFEFRETVDAEVEAWSAILNETLNSRTIEHKIEYEDDYTVLLYITQLADAVNVMGLVLLLV
jgi:hypothetical protein